MDETRLTLTVPQAPEVLGISRALAYHLVARGELPFLRLGRRAVVPRRALERFTMKHRLRRDEADAHHEDPWVQWDEPWDEREAAWRERT